MRDKEMRPQTNESGFSTLMALVTLGCFACIVVAFAESMTVISKTHRDSASNAEINTFFSRIQKILGTQWSCTASLRGANYLEPIHLKDPANTEAVLAEEGASTGPFWSVSTIHLVNIAEVPGRPGVWQGDLDLQFEKSMRNQVGSPFISRMVLNILFDANSDGVISGCYPSPGSQAQASAACKVLGGIWNSDRSFGSQCTIAAMPAPVPTATPAPTQTPAPAPTIAANDPGQPGQAPPLGESPPSGGAPSDPAPTPTPTPTASAPSGICFDTGAGIVALPSSHMTMSGNGSVVSGVYLMNGAQLSLSGNAQVQGTLFKGTGTNVSKSGNVSIDHVSTADFSTLDQSISSFAATQTALASSVQLSKIDDSTTLNGNGHKNVVLISGDVNLTGNRALTLSGSPSDVFVINVVGKITVSGNATIVLTGGVLAKNVIFNNIGIGNEMVLAGNGAISGTFMALQRGVQVSGNGHLNGAVVAGGGINTKITISGNGLAMTPEPFCMN
jgi:hypothetical protein